jgi:hypothetical protein
LLHYDDCKSSLLDLSDFEEDSMIAPRVCFIGNRLTVRWSLWRRSLFCLTQRCQIESEIESRIDFFERIESCLAAVLLNRPLWWHQ